MQVYSALLRSPALRWAFRIAVGLLCLWIVARTVDPASLAGLLARCRPGPLVVAALLFLSGSVAGALSWMVILKPLGYPLGLWPAVRLTLVGFVLNNLIPGGVAGDVYRVFGLSALGVPKAVGAVSVVVERWAAFLALLVATAVSYAMAFPLLQGVSVDPTWVPSWTPPLLLRMDFMVGAILVALTAVFAASTAGAMAAAGHEAERFGAATGEFLEALETFRGNRRAFLMAAAINLWSPVLEGLAFSCAAAALGASLSPLLFLAFTPVFRVVTHLPVSVNALGTQEVASLMLWEPLGATAEVAVGISLLMHGLKIVVSLLGLPLYLMPLHAAGSRPPIREGAPPGTGVVPHPAGEGGGKA